MKAPGLRILTLNLHGYHAMGASPRYYEARDGRHTPAPDHVFYFSPGEYTQGHKKRLDYLAAFIQAAQPEVVLLQEVAAGRPGGALSHEVFMRPVAQDADEANSALRLAARVPAYRARLACRGNRGWITNPLTFREQRIVTPRDGGWAVVHEFDSNPYPQGILVEGFALLHHETWQCLAHERVALRCNAQGEECVFQYAALAKDTGARRYCLLVANLHAEHKLAHFEQAVAIRQWMEARRRDMARPGWSVGTLCGGDFNAEVWRPANTAPSGAPRMGPALAQPLLAYQGAPGSHQGEPCMAPWEYAVAGQFDLSCGAGREQLRQALIRSNQARDFKPWANDGDLSRAQSRVDAAIKALSTWTYPGLQEVMFQAPEHTFPWHENTCWHGADHLDRRLDHLFIQPPLHATRARLYFTKAWQTALAEPSDHPALMADLAWDM